METTKVVEQAGDFLEAHYDEELIIRAGSKKDHVVIDFKLLSEHDVELAEELLDHPETTMECFAHWIEKKYDERITVRFKNLPSVCDIPMSMVRSKHIGRLLMVEGVVKQKSPIKPQVTTSRFECSGCGAIISIVQLDERKYSEPKYCSACAKQSGFRNIHNEMLDVFSVMLEEPVENVEGGVQLARIKVLFKKDLCDNKLSRRMLQGGKVVVSGLLKEFMVLSNGKKTSKMDYYLDANYVSFKDETYADIKWTDEDVVSFKELAKNKDWLDVMKKNIFHDVHGHSEECEAAILQMFGGVGVERASLKKRGNFHVLLIGDPGSSKSSILKIAMKNSPKAMYVAGSGVTGTGLTASVVKDELLGGFTLESGAIVLCNNGTLMIDELDKIGEDFKKALHEPLADETVSINKANIQATLLARTSVLAAANPKFGSYSNYDSIYKQIDLPPALINRFDLIYPIKDSKLAPEDHQAIANKILNRGNGDEFVPAFDTKFFKKYVAYAKTINPTMPDKIVEWFSRKYSDLKARKEFLNDQSGQTIPITPRNVEGMGRLAEAVARSRLHKVITMQDASIAYNKMVSSIKQLGIDPDGDDAVVGTLTVNGVVNVYKRDLKARVLKVVRSNHDGMAHSSVVAVLVSDGFDEMDVEMVIQKLKTTGDIYEPKNGQLRCL